MSAPDTPESVAPMIANIRSEVAALKAQGAVITAAIYEEWACALDNYAALLAAPPSPDVGEAIEAAARIVDEFHDIQFSAHYPDGREKMRFTSFDVGREIRALTKELSGRIRALARLSADEGTP